MELPGPLPRHPYWPLAIVHDALVAELSANASAYERAYLDLALTEALIAANVTQPLPPRGSQDRISFLAALLGAPPPPPAPMNEAGPSDALASLIPAAAKAKAQEAKNG